MLAQDEQKIEAHKRNGYVGMICKYEYPLEATDSG